MSDKKVRTWTADRVDWNTPSGLRKVEVIAVEDVLPLLREADRILRDPKYSSQIALHAWEKAIEPFTEIMKEKK